MKTLLLARHAKSDWGEPALADHDRPLNERGRRDAPAMGRRLAERGVRPEIAVASTALRAASTARALAAELGVGRVLELDRLYAASAETILAVAAELPDGAGVALLVGHNPGMTDAVARLTGEHTPLPTCAVAECRLDVEAWAALREGSGTLVRLDTPRD